MVIFGLSILAFISWIFGIMMAVAQDLPQLEDRAQFKAAENSVVYDITGERIATLTNGNGRILIDSEDIPPVMKEATVSIEDQRFYEHRGFDVTGTLRALKADILSGSAQQGASTITQQFVKNALQAQGSRTIFEKLREVALAYHLERRWSKDKILTEYLNEIYFGEGAYGIESAAKAYFGWHHPGCGTPNDRCASDLLPWEAALLAGLISSPTGYDPRTNPDAALARRNQVLQNMVDQGYITADEYGIYSQKPIPKPSQVEAPLEDSLAPYFTSWLRQQLIDKYGAGEAFGGGLHVTSTLDLALQRQCQQIVEDHLAGLGPTASIVVLDNATGGVRAMVGGSDYQDQPFNLATQGHRQPGSAFKPFTLVTALEQGHSPEEVFSSKPKVFDFHAPGYKQPQQFVVHNYGDEYRGSASIATATTYSDNSVYAELGLQVGPQNIADTAHKMGIESPISTNPSMILGGLEEGVSPLDMAHAYETLAEDGRRISGSMAATDGGPVGIQKVTDGEGHLVPTHGGASGEDKVESEQVVPETVANTAKSILQTVVEEGTGVNANPGGYVWGKTGTTENNGDAWFVGANSEITVAVWVGFPTSTKPMTTEYGGAPVDGGTIPAEIFHDVVLSYDALKSEREAEAAATTTTSTTATTATATVPTTTTAPATTTPTTSVPTTTTP